MQISLFWLTPFILMLLSIAILPLTCGSWWHSNLNKFLVSLVLGVPVLLYFLFYFPGGIHELEHTAVEYFSFITLLAALFIISGGIYIGGDLRASPIVNSLFLLCGALLASFMGTTGAAMVLIRPLLNTNLERKHVMHTVIFFIFLVANIGGCLTPLGDPPLFMGYLFGVPFSWTFGLWKEWALMTGAVLLMYYFVDRHYYRREPVSGRQRDARKTVPLFMHGRFNLTLILGVVAAVAFIPEAPRREMVLILLSLISLFFTRRSLREKNHFTYHPIIEVAVLFFGIFLTMIPAIYLLKTRGAELGVTESWQFFWATGILSSFLDNTPTYVVFFRLAQSLGLGNEIAGMPQEVLVAISLGAVFFGAMTYIGNAPNFMVKAIAEERGVRMPSFGGYMLYSALALLPAFALVSWLWF